MATREAQCHCGQLRVETEGEPFAVSICHCLACQRRTGSAFGMQAAFKVEDVRIDGQYKDFTRISDESDRRAHTFHFCPECGSQVFSTEDDDPSLVVVAVGAFADPSFPPPTESGYPGRKHPWIDLPDSLVRPGQLIWLEVQPLYEAGDYEAAASRGLELAEANPDSPELFYNVACCESLAGRTEDAIAHLGRAIAGWDGFGEMARGDADFDPIRDEPAFRELI